MIIRIFRAIVREGRHADFKKVIEMLTLPNIKHRNGMVAFYPGQPVEANSDEFVLITVWKDSAIKKFHSSTDWIKSIIPPEALPLLQEWHDQDYKSFGVHEEPFKPLLQNL